MRKLLIISGMLVCIGLSTVRSWAEDAVPTQSAPVSGEDAQNGLGSKWYNHAGVAAELGLQAPGRQVLTGQLSWRPELYVYNKMIVRGQLGFSVAKNASSTTFVAMHTGVVGGYDFGLLSASLLGSYQYWIGQQKGGFEVGPEVAYQLNPKIWFLDKIFASYQRVFTTTAIDQFQLGVGLSF